MIKDLLDGLATMSPSIYLLAFSLGLQSGVGIYQLTRLPVLWTWLSLSSEGKKDGAMTVAAFCLSMIAAAMLLGAITVRIPSFTVQVSLWTRVIYFSLGAVCILEGLSAAGLVFCNEVYWGNFFRSHKRLIFPVALLLGFLFSLLETPICPSCGSNISLISQATLGSGRIMTGLLLLALYALGQCMPLLLLGAIWALLWRKVIRPDMLDGEVAWIASGFLLILSSLLFFWTS